MEENVFLVRWYGPFNTPEEEKLWEKSSCLSVPYICFMVSLNMQKREKYIIVENLHEVYIKDFVIRVIILQKSKNA